MSKIKTIKRAKWMPKNAKYVIDDSFGRRGYYLNRPVIPRGGFWRSIKGQRVGRLYRCRPPKDPAASLRRIVG